MVELAIVLRRCKLQKKLPDFLVDWVIPQCFEVGCFGWGLFGQNFTQIMKGFECFLLQALMNVLEDITKIQIVNGGIKLKLYEILSLKGVHTLEWSSIMYIVGKYDLKVILNGLK